MNLLIARPLFMTCRLAWLAFLLFLCSWLAGCAATGQGGKDRGASADAQKGKAAMPLKGTVLWVIRFGNELEPQLPPTSLAVFVEDAARTHGGQFAFKAHQKEPNQPSEFAVRLDLPPGSYRVTRILGTAGEGATASQFEFNTQMEFRVFARESVYLGNLDITNRARNDPRLPATAPRPAASSGDAAKFSQGTPFVTANNEVRDDVVTLHTLWPDLRNRRIHTRLPQRLIVIGPDNTVAGGVEARFPAPGVPSGEYVKAAPLASDAGHDLSPQARKAFAKFKSMKQPRAFAVGPADAFGAVSLGEGVVARALAACEAKRQPRGSPPACRLYAVDDTLMSELVTRPPVKATSARTDRVQSMPRRGGGEPVKRAVARSHASS
jgi:hypothetical protein